MENWPRYRIVSSLSREKMMQEVRELELEGWSALGEPALAVAARPEAPPYWVQTLYCEKPLPPTVIYTKPPRKSPASASNEMAGGSEGSRV
jgi:hypothetical protein